MDGPRICSWSSGASCHAFAQKQTKRSLSAVSVSPHPSCACGSHPACRSEADREATGDGCQSRPTTTARNNDGGLPDFMAAVFLSANPNVASVYRYGLTPHARARITHEANRLSVSWLCNWSRVEIAACPVVDNPKRRTSTHPTERGFRTTTVPIQQYEIFFS